MTMPGRTTALVLEDEPILGFALEDMLLELGFREIKLAATLAEASDYLDEWTPDVAILDVNIQGERSYKVAERLIEAGIPFAFATGYGNAEHPAQLRDITTLTKPYSQEDLRAFVDATVGK